MKKYVGIDLGGTNVRAALINAEGEVLALNKSASNPEKGAEHVVKVIVDLVRSLPNQEEAEAIGIAVPGLIDVEQGTIKAANNLSKLVDYPLTEKLSGELDGRRVVLANDGKAAAIGEALAGAGKGNESVYYVTISTGIGGAAVIQGKVLMGRHGFAGEVGNMIVNERDSQYGIMNKGAVESGASGTAVTRKGKERIDASIQHAGEVFERAAQHHEEALKIVDEMTDDLSNLLSAISLVIDPDVIVLGGGVMKGADVFMPALQEKWRGKLFEAMRDVELVLAKLDEPGIVGAAMYAMTWEEK